MVLTKPSQSGFSLLFFVLILMGLGGAALIGFGQNALKDVKAERFKHNQRVLEQAKQALLMYAYNYPDFPGLESGPGRLPCPYDVIGGYSGALSTAICEAVGRLPWDNNLSLPEFKDADGEHLWYAVSSSFYNLNGGPVINSDSQATITLRDQSGNISYDGNIAAIIIAPGSALFIDTDNDGVLDYNQVRDRNTPANPINNQAANFLDAAFGEDNSAFVNDVPPNPPVNDGFIPGPIIDANNNLLVNDQIIIITEDEVIEMAEKSTLQTYKQALEDYRSNWTASPNSYPWLNSYDQIPADDPATPTPNDGLTVYDVTVGQTFGRIPSIFGLYFQDNNSEQVYSDIDIDYRFSIAAGATDDLDQFNTGSPYDPPNIVLGRAKITFTDTGGTDTGQLLGTTVSQVLTTEYVGESKYFWDEPGAAANGWELCVPNVPLGATVMIPPALPGTTQEQWDARVCNQSSLNVFVTDPNVNNNSELIQVRKLTLKADFSNYKYKVPPDPAPNVPGGPKDIIFEMDYTVPPAITYAAPTAADHAKISASFPAGSVIDGTAFLYFEVEGDIEYLSLYRDVPNEEINEIINVPNVSFDQFDITLDYFPELPDWAGQNENNWNSSIMMAYADAYKPQAIPVPDCNQDIGDTIDDCIVVNNIGGVNNNFKSLLLMAGEHDFVDDAADGFFNDLADIFEGENATIPTDLIFDKRPNVTPVNKQDTIFILDTL